MRTTVRIEDDLLAQLKEQAQRERVSLTLLLDRTLRAGIRAAAGRRPRRAPYREEPRSLGAPRVDLDKALAVASSLEDEEVARKLGTRK